MNPSKYFYNNEALGIVAIASVLKHCEAMSISKILLILPIVTHRETLDYLKRSNSNVRSIEQLLMKKSNLVTNFNKRYEFLLPVSLNSINLLCEMKIACYENEKIKTLNQSKFNFNHSQLGTRAKEIVKASKKVACILDKDINDLYLQLRVEL